MTCELLAVSSVLGREYLMAAHGTTRRMQITYVVICIRIGCNEPSFLWTISYPYSVP